MSEPRAIVIVGAGLAGAKAAEALREHEGFDGTITLIGDEQWRPYERPPLSKDYLQGKVDRDGLFVHDPSWYTDHQVDLRLDAPALAIDRDQREVILTDGRVHYDRLLLATGARPRRLRVPGADADGVHYLRRIDDCDRLREVLRTASRIAVIGGGWIGLEAAAAARAAGVAVTVVEVGPMPLHHVLGAHVAPVFAELHRSHGVDLRCAVGVDEIITTAGVATGLRLHDGDRVDADAILVGIGATPNTALASAAGLQTDSGIVVDASLRSSDPHIFAVGDIARAYHPLFKTHIRVEHWANALHQPATAAAAMLGRHRTYDRLPYFYTDQYDLGMEYTGYVEPNGYDQVVTRGKLDTREFVAFWLREGRVLAGMNVNIWDVNATIDTLIRSQTCVDTTLLADPAAPLSDLHSQ